MYESPAGALPAPREWILCSLRKCLSAKPVVPGQLGDTSVVLWDHQVQAEPGDVPGTFCLL